MTRPVNTRVSARSLTWAQPHCLLLLLVWTNQALSAQPAAPTDVIQLDALLPPSPPTGEDAYLCTSVPLPDKPMKLTGVTPLSKQEVVHHMLMFGKLVGWFAATVISERCIL